jgi:hypothetical protein
MASRPYQNHSEAELLNWRRGHEDALRGLKRRKSDFEKRVGSHFWEFEGYKEIEGMEKNVWSEISAIDRELAARRS